MIKRALLVAAVVLTGCESSPAPIPCSAAPSQTAAVPTDVGKRTATVRKRIEDADARIVDAMKRGDLAGCVQFYAPDAVVWDDSVEHALQGRAAIEGFWRPLMGNIKDATLTVDEVQVSGSLAYETDHGTWTIAGSPPLTGHGKFLLIWKEQPDGTWLVVRESGNGKTIN